ncbi:BSD domain-containing family protein [Populus alba x Populus x berolinensis]|nr:BSD domain-containing family protein [Populus alba x Populus x berolinensis]
MQEARWQPTDRQSKGMQKLKCREKSRLAFNARMQPTPFLSTHRSTHALRASITTISECTVHVPLRLLYEFGSLLRGDATKAVQKKTSILKRVDSPKSPPPSSENLNPDPSTQNSTWFFGSLIQALATKSEFVIEIYKKDLEEFGSKLKNESSIIHDVPSRAGHDLPASFETNAVVAQEFVGQAISGIRSSMWKSTAQIISQVRDSILASDHDRDLLLSNTDTNRSSLGKQYNRFEAQEEIERFISENGVIREIYGGVVANKVDDESFLSRFFL